MPILPPHGPGGAMRLVFESDKDAVWWPLPVQLSALIGPLLV
jgi:hypothetical protein